MVKRKSAVIINFFLYYTMAWKIEDINDILNVVKEKADMYPQSIKIQNAGHGT